MEAAANLFNSEDYENLFYNIVTSVGIVFPNINGNGNGNGVSGSFFCKLWEKYECE